MEGQVRGATRRTRTGSLAPSSSDGSLTSRFERTNRRLRIPRRPAKKAGYGGSGSNQVGRVKWGVVKVRAAQDVWAS